MNSEKQTRLRARFLGCNFTDSEYPDVEDTEYQNCSFHNVVNKKEESTK